MNLYYLQYFLAVARRESFSKAARDMGRSCFQRLGMDRTLYEHAALDNPQHNISSNRNQRDKPLTRNAVFGTTVTP